MSWGERSCKLPCRCLHTCFIETCNVDCPSYQWDGSTKPDSKPMKTERAYDRIHALTDDSLADALLNIWGKFPLGSEEGLQLEEAIDRLRKIPTMNKNYISAVQGRRDFREALKKKKGHGDKYTRE